MAMPVLSATLNKASYVPGEVASLTVVYSDGNTKSNVITITGRDQSGNQAQVTVSVSVVDRIDLTVQDDSGRVWSLVQDDGTTAIFTATI